MEGKNQKKLYTYLEKQNPNEYKEKLEYFKKIKKWAKEHKYLKPPQERENLFSKGNKS